MFNVVVPNEKNAKKKELLELIESRCAPDELRSLAGTLVRLADAVDQNWSTHSQSVFNWRREIREIERDALNLAMRAKREQERRAIRRPYIPAEFLGEPAWEMLLELFCQYAGGAKVSVKSLTFVSGLPPTTALRMIERLVEAGFIARSSSETDGRVVLLCLTREGILAVGRALRKLC